jgi:hypothetical protein
VTGTAIEMRDTVVFEPATNYISDESLYMFDRNDLGQPTFKPDDLSAQNRNLGELLFSFENTSS